MVKKLCILLRENSVSWYLVFVSVEIIGIGLLGNWKKKILLLNEFWFLEINLLGFLIKYVKYLYVFKVG